ncbi:MAG: isocitrate/isopropylmalate dehydrogenase family protein [Candidatus Omnitrophica bacterium]|nr:isocitrate/isopropylmalate dehydrogenase family protein [Candidatus Omnitrophota bacterium]
MYKVTLIPGDGIGPEVTQAAQRCIDATGVKIEWEQVLAGAEALKKDKELLPQATLSSIKKNKIALKGPVVTPIGEGFRSVNVAIRQLFNLYACLRPCKWYPGVRSRYQDIDLVVIRENTEDLYAGIEFEQGKKQTHGILEKINQISAKKISPDSALSIKPISITGTKRIIRFAFEYALANNRKRLTCVHKANIMKFTDGLFLKVAREIAEEYSGKIEFDDRLIDNMCLQLVKNPQEYDCLVLPNLYGDIISDLCAGLIGGLGLAPGANIGDEIAIFEATHGSAPKYKGRNKVNPTAMILSGVMLLRHIGEAQAADRLEQAVCAVIKEGKHVTYDFKEKQDQHTAIGTSQMAGAIIERLR